jgi:putative Mg2+ transporter-C (MgtC) family protein
MSEPWLRLWTDTVPLAQQPTFIRLLFALVLGALIGAERQWRQRAAGLRTNTLVCLGAAAFVDLGATLAGPATTGVIAYVISGVGFLGAGAIIKDGASIRGLNTAATLWCSAAVGACAGCGELLDAVFVTILLVGINLVLRPLSRFIDRRSVSHGIDVVYRITVVCPAESEVQVRALLLRAIAERRLVLRQLRTADIGEGEEVSISAEVEAERRDDSLVDGVADALRGNEAVRAVERAEGPAESE